MDTPPIKPPVKFKLTPPPFEKRCRQVIEVDTTLLTPPSTPKKKKPTIKVYSAESTLEEKTLLLFQLAKDGNADDLVNLISLGIDINAKNFRGCTALILAVDKNHINVIDILIKAKANIFLQDNKNHTALHHAILNNYEFSAFMLLECMSRKEREIFKQDILLKNMILKFEARRINAQNEKGESMFMLAARYGHVETARGLVAAGADINLKDSNGKTAEEHAQEYRESFRDTCIQMTADLYQRQMLIFSFSKPRTNSLPLPITNEEIDEEIVEGIKNLKIDNKSTP